MIENGSRQYDILHTFKLSEVEYVIAKDGIKEFAEFKEVDHTKFILQGTEFLKDGKTGFMLCERTYPTESAPPQYSLGKFTSDDLDKIMTEFVKRLKKQGITDIEKVPEFAKEKYVEMTPPPTPPKPEKIEPTPEELAEAEKQAILDEIVPLDISQIKGGETIQLLNPEELNAFKGHPFVNKSDKKYLETLASIKKGGVHTPIIVRPLKDETDKVMPEHSSQGLTMT